MPPYRKLWTPEEDRALTEAVERVTKERVNRRRNATRYSMWRDVAAEARWPPGSPVRDGKSCRERYSRALKRRGERRPPTAEEELVIADMAARLGNRWKTISEHIGISERSMKTFARSRLPEIIDPHAWLLCDERLDEDAEYDSGIESVFSSIPQNTAVDRSGEDDEKAKMRSSLHRAIVRDEEDEDLCHDDLYYVEGWSDLFPESSSDTEDPNALMFS